MRSSITIFLILNFLFHPFSSAYVSEFYMNEYECIDKILWNPSVFQVLQNEDEKACEIGVSFNLEMIFRKAEEILREEEGFKAIIEILDGKFGNVKSDISDTAIEEAIRQTLYDEQLQQLAIDYLITNEKKKKALGLEQKDNENEYLTPEVGEDYLARLRVFSKANSETDLELKEQNLNLQEEKFSVNDPNSEDDNDDRFSDISLNRLPTEKGDFL